MEKTILIDDKEVRLRATAAVPRLYRLKFGQDIIKDVLHLQKQYEAAEKEGGKDEDFLERVDLSVLENIAYILAKHADPLGVPKEPEEWLAQFGGFSLYGATAEIIGFWVASMQGSIPVKKN